MFVELNEVKGIVVDLDGVLNQQNPIDLPAGEKKARKKGWDEGTKWPQSAKDILAKSKSPPVRDGGEGKP